VINGNGGSDWALYEVKEAASLIQERSTRMRTNLGAVIGRSDVGRDSRNVIATGSRSRQVLRRAYSRQARLSPADLRGLDGPVDPMEVSSRSPRQRRPGRCGCFRETRPVRRMGLVVDDSPLEIRRSGGAAKTPAWQTARSSSRIRCLDGDDTLDIPTSCARQLD